MVVKSCLVGRLCMEVLWKQTDEQTKHDKKKTDLIISA